MLETQLSGMQCLPVQVVQSRPSQVRKADSPREKPTAIDRIAQNRMADVREVYADLMGAAGFEMQPDEGRDRLVVAVGERFEHLVMCHGVPSGIVRHHRYFQAVL